MRRVVEGADRGQSTLFPECLDDWIDEDNPVRVIDVFVDELDLGALDFGGVDPKATGRPSYHPSILLKLYRHKGQLLLRQGHSEVAEELYRKALRIAVEQEAKLWELRAAVSLARLWADQGRRTEARDLLAPVYGWFTEGFDTAGLKDAKALLDELT